MLNLQQILDDILAGTFDGLGLDRIESAVRQRRELIATRNFVGLRMGDKFLISNRVKPKLLAGKVVKVVGWGDNDKVIVELLDDVNQKWRAGNEISLTKGLIGPRI